MTVTIIGVSLENRMATAMEFQRIATEFGCEIRTRVGLHPSPEDMCINRGIVLLEVYGEAELLRQELSKHWHIQIMQFE